MGWLPLLYLGGSRQNCGTTAKNEINSGAKPKLQALEVTDNNFPNACEVESTHVYAVLRDLYQHAFQFFGDLYLAP